MNRLFAAWFAALLLLYPPAAGAQDIGSRDVDVCIKALIRELGDSQSRDGSWSYSSYTVGCTALCLLALKRANLPNDHPVVRQATRYVAEHSDSRVYSEALVAVALEQVDPKRYRTRIKRAYGYLETAQARNGAWTYDARGANGIRHDNSNTQFAVLGIAAAERCGITVDARLKKRARQHWLNTQERDGSWGYVGGSRVKTEAMTLAGLASLHLLGEKLERKPRACGEYERNKGMYAALSWIAGRMKKGTPGNVFTNSRRYYALYALERVAIFLGIKDIAGVDWYRWGATWILKQQDMKRIRTVPDKAFALLFLAKGKAPIAIAKWHWDGDWNNQHQDVQNWCRIAGKALERNLDWLPARLDRLDSPAAKASMIFVNGRETFKAAPEEIEFLKSFLDEGGTVVAEVTCDEMDFVRAFEQTLCKEMYPDLNPKFIPINKDHPVTWIKHRLELKDVSALEFRAGCKRLNVLILRRNISCPLNGDLDVQRDLLRAGKVATNIVAWALQNRKAGEKLDEVQLDEPPARVALTADQIKRLKARKSKQFRQAFGRLKHGGNWYAAPRYFATLKEVLKLRDDFPRFDGEVYVGPRRNDLFQSAVLFVTGYDDPALKEADVVNLRTYVQNGGTIFATNACSSKEFNLGFRKLVKQTFPNDKFERIPPSDSLFKKPFDLTKHPAKGTRAYQRALKREWAPLYGIRREGRWVLVYAPVDMVSDMSEGLHESVIGFKKESAAILSVNILYHALLP